MNTKLATAMLTAAAIAASASAQSASVNLSASASAVQPGDTVTITVTADYDTNGAPAGVFGSAGFYGFGGNVTAAGTTTGTAASPVNNAALTAGSTTDLAAPGALVRAAAGRGLNGGLADDPATMLTFDLTVDAGAQSGDTITVDYDGAVVLVLGDALTTFSTSPGANQQSLTVNPLTLTIGGGGCSPADITTTGSANGTPDGVVDLSDFSFYLTLWSGSDAQADITTTGSANGVPDGVVDLSDFSFYLTLWSAGCP